MIFNYRSRVNNISLDDLGEREDWRFTEYRAKYKKYWWWLSFFLVYVSQQVLLVGISLPLYSIYFSERRNQQWNLLGWDGVATLCCLSGVIVAYFADTQVFYCIPKIIIGIHKHRIFQLIRLSVIIASWVYEDEREESC